MFQYLWELEFQFQFLHPVVLLVDQRVRFRWTKSSSNSWLIGDCDQPVVQLGFERCQTWFLVKFQRLPQSGWDEVVEVAAPFQDRFSFQPFWWSCLMTDAESIPRVDVDFDADIWVRFVIFRCVIEV